jgi:hypothetical protein
MKLISTRESKFSNKIEASYRQDLAVMLCRLGLFLFPVASITSSLVADHMATVHACDKARESMLVSYISEPILAFGAMKQWNKRGLCPLLHSIRSALIRGIVNEGTLGEITAMILLLKSMDELDAGLAWSNVHDFLEKLVSMEKSIQEELVELIPKESELNFNHFVQWFAKFDPSDLRVLLKRRAACILQRNQDGADLLIPFFVRGGENIKFGAILVQVKNRLQPSDAKDVGTKLFASSVFKHWDEEERNIPLFRVVLELGLSSANKDPSSFPMARKVDLVEVSVTRDQTTVTDDGEATFIVTSSNSRKEKLFIAQDPSRFVKEGTVKLLRLLGIAGVPWIDKDKYDAFIELLEGPFAPETMSSWTDDVDTACYWEGVTKEDK